MSGEIHRVHAPFASAAQLLEPGGQLAWTSFTRVAQGWSGSVSVCLYLISTSTDLGPAVIASSGNGSSDSDAPEGSVRLGCDGAVSPLELAADQRRLRTCSSLEPDRRFIAVGCRDHTTRIWDTAHDQLLAELPSVTQIDGDFASAFPAVSAAGDRAAIARGNAVEVYELPGGRLVRTIAHGAADEENNPQARGP